MEDSFVTPTPKDRLIALAKLSVPLLCLGAVHGWAHLYSEYVSPLCTCQQLPGLRATIFAAATVLTVLIIATYRYAVRILRSGQYPPPGASILLRRRIVYGWRAVVQAASVLFFTLGLLVFVALLLRHAVLSEVGLYVLGFQACEP